MLGLFAAAVAGCGSRVAPPAAVSPELRPNAPFVPGTTTSERRSRLEAIAPQLDELLRARMREAGVPSLVAGVVLDGELAYARAFGVRDLASNDPVDGDTVFRIASMTKSFTAMAILKLRDEGKVSLDADASTYLPMLRDLRGLPRDSVVTVRLLLTHASGLPGDDYWGGDSFGMSADELARFLHAGVKMSYPPGERYAYSNLGYALLGRIVEQVSGRRFRDYVSEEILKPLGMTSSVWEASDVPPKRLASGYWKASNGTIPEPRPPDGVFDAAGGLYTSLHDYARYVAFNLAAYPARDDQPESGPVRRRTRREMHAGQRPMRMDDYDAPLAQRTPDGISLRAGSYGFGWLAVSSCNDERVQHGGYEPGYFSTVVLLPRYAAGVFAFSSTERVPVGALLGALAGGGVLGKPPQAPPIGELVASAAAIDRLVAAWDADLVTHTFDGPSLKFAWFATLHDDFARLAARHGACRRSGAIKTYGRHRGLWTLNCDRGTIEFDALMTPGTPARVEIVKWSEELPPDDRQNVMATRLVAALGGKSDIAAATKDLFAASADRDGLTRRLAHLAIDCGGGVVSQGAVRSHHEPFGDDGPRVIFRLVCARGDAVDVELTLDDQSDRVVDLVGHPPRDPDASCWQ